MNKTTKMAAVVMVLMVAGLLKLAKDKTENLKKTPITKTKLMPKKIKKLVEKNNEDNKKEIIADKKSKDLRNLDRDVNVIKSPEKMPTGREVKIDGEVFTGEKPVIPKVMGERRVRDIPASPLIAINDKSKKSKNPPFAGPERGLYCDIEIDSGLVAFWFDGKGKYYMWNHANGNPAFLKWVKDGQEPGTSDISQSGDYDYLKGKLKLNLKIETGAMAELKMKTQDGGGSGVSSFSETADDVTYTKESCLKNIFSSVGVKKSNQ